ncbi:MAG: L,D-transpeptidase [Pseudolabrys sp.]|nr:L,D-transpeptidase [Pseudolabrys sp.]
MRLRLAVVAFALLALCPVTQSLAESPFGNDPYELYSGGNTRKYLGINRIRREEVRFNDSKYKPGDIVVNTKERRLYHVEDNGYAMVYGIGVGRAGFQWGGVHKVTAKKENPTWTPPPEMRARQKGLPAMMKGGDPENPLGVRAMYLGSTLYRIHGSNDPDSIGEAESSGCFRMTNEDVKHLYERTPVGTTVYVLR